MPPTGFRTKDERKASMKPQKHTTAVRIFCLVFAVLMIVSLLSSVIFTLSYAA